MPPSPTAISESGQPRGSAARSHGTGAAPRAGLHLSNILGAIRRLLLCFGRIGADPGTSLPKPSLPVRLALLVAGTTLPLIIFAAGIGVQQLQAGSAERDPARAGNRAQHPPRARCRDAAHDRRAAGAVADQFAARRRFRRFPPDRAGLPRPIRRRRRHSGGRPRRPAGVFLGHDGYDEPAATQQPRHRRQGLRRKEARLLQPVHRRGEEASDRDRRSAGHSRRRGDLRHLLQPADRNFSGHDRAAAAEQGLDDLDLRRRRHQFRTRAESAGRPIGKRASPSLYAQMFQQSRSDLADGIARRRAADHEPRRAPRSPAGRLPPASPKARWSHRCGATSRSPA